MLTKTIKSMIRVLSFVALTWVSIHIFGLFGVFFTCFYFVFSLLFRQRSICLGCLFGKTATICKFCGLNIEKLSNFPRNFKSIVLNAVVFFVISFLSMFIILFEYKFILYSGLIGNMQNVNLQLNTDSAHSVNKEFSLDINLVDISVPINVIQADIGYDPSIVEVISISTIDSFATVFVEEIINNEIGFARISGGIPNPGFLSSKGTFAKIIFKSRHVGETEVKLLPTSVVLANDGFGTNLLKNYDISKFIIVDQLENEYNDDLDIKIGNVLGDKRDKNKLYLYDQQMILSSTTVNSVQKIKINTGYSLVNQIFYYLSKLDLFILKTWNSLKL